MKVQILAVWKAKGPLAAAITEYERRAAHYWKISVEEVASGTKSTSGDPGLVMKAEGQRIITRIPKDFEVVALTRSGSGMDSRGFARYLGKRAENASAGIAFIVGGAYGLGEAVLSQTHRKLALSPMTLPHQVARLVLAEQLYRAGTILRGEPYHKG